MSAGTLLTGLRVWDGERTLEADSVRLEGGRIAAVGSALERTRGDRIIDCAGATALPGLMDAHVHLELDPHAGAPPQPGAERNRGQMTERAGAMVRAGITTARDLGGGAWAELELRGLIAAGAVAGPRLLCAGQPITSPGGHCHFWGGEAADLCAARAVLARQVDKGVDVIKVMATGGMFTRGSRPDAAQFDLETLAGIVAAAREHGLPVAAHCHGTDGIELCARSGVRTIEHCSWMGTNGWAGNYDEDIARLVLHAGAWVSPTVNRGWQRYLDSADPLKLHRIRAAYRAMAELGIPFVASTDAGIPGVFHHDLPAALAVFQRITQWPADAILRSATSGAARALGLEGVTGRLAPGLAADLLLVDGDPLTDLEALGRPVQVWARGQPMLPLR